MHPARKIWDVLEPISANVYFAPEVHGALAELGFGGGSVGPNGIHYPDGLAYMASRGGCLGQVSGHVIASAFGVFKRQMVVAAVDAAWQVAGVDDVLAARERGAVASLERLLGPEPDGLSWATDVLRRMAEAGPLEGRHLAAGLTSLGYPGTPMGEFWRAGDIVREHRGDSHIAAWIGADLDASEIGLLTDPWRGQPLRSWVRSRGWTDDELDAACDRLRSRGLLDGDELTTSGMELRETIESATDAQEVRIVAALGDDADRFFALLDRWADQVVAGNGYPGRVQWSLATSGT
ncbi:MAG: hypothetical protein S0880_36965 [Actinomycetota bacterium]|nr:hypothetical protein [Actinomycetota bacterium]